MIRNPLSAQGTPVHTDKSVSEVAYAVGFTAPSYFSKCFKEEYGIVPGDIRK